MNERELLDALRALPRATPPDPARLLADFQAPPRRGDRGARAFVAALFAGAALALSAPPASPTRVLDEGVLLRAQAAARVCIQRLEELR